MQRLTLVRYAIKPERVEENDALCRSVFDELRANPPKDIFYACYKEADGVSYAHLFANRREDSSDAVTGLASFAAYQASLLDRCAEPPKAIRLGVEVIDSFDSASHPR
jgi:hypothetical protein